MLSDFSFAPLTLSPPRMRRTLWTLWLRKERPLGNSTVSRLNFVCLAACTVKRSDGRLLVRPETLPADNRGEPLEGPELEPPPEALDEPHPWIVKCEDGVAVLSPFWSVRVAVETF